MTQPTSTSDSPSWRIEPVRQADRASVLNFLANSGGLMGVPSSIESPAPHDEKVGVHQLWVGLEGVKKRAAVWIIPRPGRIAMIFLSPPSRLRQVEPVAQVIDRACQAVDSRQATLVQAMLDESSELEQAALQRAGFMDLAVLDYMQRPIGRSHRPPLLPPEMTLHDYCRDRRDDFIAMLDASYEQTLDCPGICGRRRTEDVLEGHRASGVFRASMWSLVCWQGRPAGVMLLAWLPQHQLVELVYLGLSVEFRGRGWGRLLMEHALHQCVQMQADWFCTAVDRDNAPACRLYRSMGFQRTARKLAMIRPLVDKP
jgi:ribosomal protein S18 acetylase RimI-like enzyme